MRRIVNNGEPNKQLVSLEKEHSFAAMQTFQNSDSRKKLAPSVSDLLDDLVVLGGVAAQASDGWRTKISQRY